MLSHESNTFQIVFDDVISMSKANFQTTRKSHLVHIRENVGGLKRIFYMRLKIPKIFQILIHLVVNENSSQFEITEKLADHAN